MLPEIGTFAIVLALCFSVLQFSTTKNTLSIAAAFNQTFFLFFAFCCLVISFLKNDFSVLYIWQHSHQLLPLLYRFGASWGGHEGSLLLFCLILSSWCIAFILFSSHFEKTLRHRMIRILGLVNSGFIAFLFLTSNPFKRQFPLTSIVGNDLTPVLQDPGLLFHPPILYIGYVGFVILFAFAIAILLQGKVDKKDFINIKPWLLLSWSVLTGGIVLGSWWAYRELGWGGWWFWDPVENASLLPWLSATALIHSIKTSEKTGSFLGWTLFLAIFTFVLCLFGTFLVRSGILVSVHAFANDPARGIFLLCYLAILVGSAFFIYALKIINFSSDKKYHFLSKEIFLIINVIILFTFSFTILLGMLYPITLETLGMEKISIGEPYFDFMAITILLPLFFIMGWAPHINWHKEKFYPLIKRLYPALLLAVILSIILPKLFFLPFYFLTTVGLSVGLWIFFSTTQYAYELIQQKQWRTCHWAMLLAHIGIAILIIGISINKSFSEERQIKIAPGEHVSLAGYEFYFKNIVEKKQSNYQSIVANFEIQKNNKVVDLVASEIRLYPQNQLFNKTGIVYNVWRDLSLALGPYLEQDNWYIRLYYKPFVRWIWFGGFLLVLGGLLTLIYKEKNARN